MSPEHMTKKRYLLMLPMALMGIIPFILGLLLHYAPLATFGAIHLYTCTGDMYNVLTGVLGVPNKAKIYLYDMVNYWYIEVEQ